MEGDSVSDPTTTSRSRRTIDLVLSVVRKHLGLDVAFVSRFREQDRVLEHVDTSARPAPLHAGQAIALAEGYCRKVVDGDLPGLIVDARQHPVARHIPDTESLPIGSHISVPIRLADGSLYGTFCCLSFESQRTLTTRDLRLMRAFGDLIAGELEADAEDVGRHAIHAARIARVLADGGPDIVFQPILHIGSGRIEGFECLSRFPAHDASSVPDADPDARWTPDRWFREAQAIGLGPELEIAAIQRALSHLDAFSPDTYLAVNCSAMTILGGGLDEVFAAYPGRRVVLEITEHDHVDDYAALRRALAPLRAAGIRIAIDDTGAGYASMRHVLQLDPDKIKLDISLTRGLDVDAKKRALVAALCAFGRESKAVLVAEGVEQVSESRALSALGVDCLQGWLIGWPTGLDEALRLDADGPSIASIRSEPAGVAAAARRRHPKGDPQPVR